MVEGGNITLETGGGGVGGYDEELSQGRPGGR